VPRGVDRGDRAFVARLLNSLAAVGSRMLPTGPVPVCRNYWVAT